MHLRLTPLDHPTKLRDVESVTSTSVTSSNLKATGARRNTMTAARIPTWAAESASRFARTQFHDSDPLVFRIRPASSSRPTVVASTEPGNEALRPTAPCTTPFRCVNCSRSLSNF